jgi:hypothetical protein
MARIGVALCALASVMASSVVACSAPGSFFSVDELGLGVRAAKLARVEAEPAGTSAPAPEETPASPPIRGPDEPRAAPGGSPAPHAEEATDDIAPSVLVATARQTLVYARPSLKAPKLGYLRAGAVVPRAAKAAGFEGCRGGFYEVAPEGYVCAGSGASLDPDSELARAVPRRADRTATLPYEYGAANGVAGAPLYSRIPSIDDMRAAEPAIAGRTLPAPSFDGLSFDEPPWFLRDGGASISTSGARFSRTRVVLGNAIAKSAFAFVSLFEASGRRFGLTVEGAVVPLDRLTRVMPSPFHGLPLDGEASLPVVFPRSRTPLYSGDLHGGLRVTRWLDRREVVPITGKRVHVAASAYLVTRDGGLVPEQGVTRVDPLASPPGWAAGNRRWIDVSIDRQSLVAYEGSRPVFVTLVSTGIDGKGDPETTHSTIQGQFLIHTKHVTITMDGDEVGDEFDFRDVPYVQYFKDGFALHAAYWHDGFGAPRSHGCVNLSPLDARWLFSWTEPSVPVAWHGAMSAHGTLVSIHP